MRMNRRGVVLGAIALTLAGCTGRGSGPDAAAAARAALRAGGHVVYFRHAATAWSGHDSHTWPREEQRLLSPEGAAQARRIGARFDALGIAVDEVRTSPFHRTRDTGRLAFGEITVDPGLLSIENTGGPPGRLDHLRGLLSSPVPGPGNRVLVSHRGNLLFAAAVHLAEAEAAVFRPDGAAGFTLIGRVAAGDW